MITGYVSSDDEDDYDFGYSEPLVRRSESPSLLSIESKELREGLHSALERSKKLNLFLKAVSEEDLSTLEELIRLGVQVDSSEPQEWTPLMKACGKGKFEAVNFLLEHGSNPNLHKELFTPLMACCTYSHVDESLKLNCVRSLLQHGADVNAKDKYKSTALMYAVENGYQEIVDELLSVPNIEINVQDKEGWSALFYAVNHNHIEIAEKLITAGSNLNLKDRCSRTVLNLALDKDLKEIASILGYVEENVEVSEEENNKNHNYEFFDELPSSNGEGGFYSEAQNILNLFNQFKVQTVSLPDFLNATDKGLYDIGVKIKHDRQKILKNGIHRYHLHPWKKSSMYQVSQKVPMSMENTIAITGNIVRHLTIANASLRYLETRLSSRKNDTPLDTVLEKELINILVNIYTTNERLNISLHRILKSVNEIEPISTGDYIYPTEKDSIKLSKYLLCALGATAAYFFVQLYKSQR